MREGYVNDKGRHTVRAAVFVLLLKDGKMFLLRRQNTGWADGMLTVPSGHVDAKETIPEAAIKEVREEAGVLVKEEDLEFMHVHYVHDTYVNLYFKAEKWEGEPSVAEPELASECLWVPVDDLPHDVIYHIKAMLRETTQNNYFSGVENDPNPTNQ